MMTHLRPAATLLLFLTLVLGLAYPVAMTELAGAIMPRQAGGSLILRDGQPVGSSLVGQAFSADGYVHPRPSAAGGGYDAAASAGSNLGPTSARLAARLNADAAAMRATTGAERIPADAVTTSGSGLDPEISPANAALQVDRIAAARGISQAAVRAILADATHGRTFGLLGEPRVNVLRANMALDAAAPLAD